MLDVSKGVRAAALSLILGAVCLLPSQARAQLGSLVVTITSPASGSAVNGTIPVNASVSSLGIGVAGVQFTLDGVNLGAEDTSAPYSVPWNTTTTSDGSHTLVAIARDALGVQFSSNPVTVRVANGAPPPTPVTRYEDTDASVTYSAGWSQRGAEWFVWSGGTATQSVAAGAQATFTFTGTSVAWIGYRSGFGGIARVSIDGVVVSDVDLFARMDEVHVPVFTVGGLTNSSHTLTIQVTGLKNQEAVANEVVIDAFDVPAPAVSHLQNTDPDISYSGSWTQGDASRSWSGSSATVSSTPNAQATLPFNGTSITWIGYRGPTGGIARVFIDGSLAGEVDTYSPSDRVQDFMFTATGLADSNHTLTIDVTGLRNAASTGTLIVIDAFDVTSPGRRFQETAPSVTYTGSWTQGNLNKPWSEGTVATSNVAGSQATFTFNGTAVRWIGCRKFTTGIAQVFLDGVFVEEIDTYSPVEGYQDTVYSASGLANGTHTLTIQATGRSNPASASSYVVIDAFDIRP